MRLRFSRLLLHALLLCTACGWARAEKPHLLFGCEARPENVHPGEPVNVTGMAMYADTHRVTDYTWQTTGGRLSSSNEHATIVTAGLPPGEYTVTGNITQGQKANQQAVCTTRFKVVPFEPPSVSCRATPNAGTSGSTFDISALAVSAQNRPITYAFSTSAGHLTPSGVTAKLATKDVPPGIVKVTCYVVDDRGLSASATAQISLTSQLAATGTQLRRLCSLNFNHDSQHPVRVDALAEGCLDSIAFTLQQNPGSKLVIVGNASPTEAPEASAERGMNARQYLTTVRGIPASRIELRVGETSGPTADTILLPAGVAFNQVNTSTFDESLIILHGTPYVPPGTKPTHTAAHH